MSRSFQFRPLLVVLAFTSLGFAAELRPPPKVVAGTAFTIETSASGSATFYLIGPTQISKRKVELQSGISVQPEEVESAGRYTAVVCAGECTSASFYVQSAAPARLALLVHPSRVPVADTNAMSAVALVFDHFQNLVLTAERVRFSITPRNAPSISEARSSDRGIAWTQMTSGRKEGPVQIIAAVGNDDAVRVVQQIASEACNLRMKGEWTAGKFFVETDPVRDCSGNNVPDGTIVSFTENDSRGKTTVDVPIKKGIAKVEIPVSGEAHITVASGVVTGNELNVTGRQ